MDQRTAAFQRGADHGVARQGRQQAVDLGLDGGDVGRIRTQQNALGHLVVLGLAEQIHGYPVRRGAAIGQHQDFARAGDHVDAHLAEHAPLGAGHIGIARPGDLVDCCDGGCAVGQRPHRLRAAYGEHPVHTGHGRRRQYQGIAVAIRGGDHHHDLAHARHPGRHGAHQHAGRIGRLAAWHVDAHAIKWRDLLAEQGAV